MKLQCKFIEARNTEADTDQVTKYQGVSLCKIKPSCFPICSE